MSQALQPDQIDLRCMHEWSKSIDCNDYCGYLRDLIDRLAKYPGMLPTKAMNWDEFLVTLRAMLNGDIDYLSDKGPSR